jgi:hypothetical protein
MLDPPHAFLSHISVLTVEHGETELANDLHRAMQHFVLPLTSEFYGVSLAALQKMLTSNGSYFPNEDKKLASTLVKEIEEKWFTPAR